MSDDSKIEISREDAAFIRKMQNMICRLLPRPWPASQLRFVEIPLPGVEPKLELREEVDPE